ncbi:MAG: CBS domain-containing protein [Acetobacteraceae bacterium]|nr:CBS domain-containing protein [Acetobacteraceae bacterium]
MIIASILGTKGGDVVAVAPEDTVLTVARTMTQHRIGAALVRDPQGAILGIISERDIVRGMAGHGPGTSLVPAAQLMTRDLVTVSPRTLVTEALALMTQHRVRHLPVLDEAGRLVGLVSIGDLVKARIDEAEHEAQELRAYVVSAG